jgi:hypothetical protein
LQAPDESGRGVGQRIDVVEARDEAREQRIIDWRQHAPDVDLCDMEARWHLRFSCR